MGKRKFSPISCVRDLSNKKVIKDIIPWFFRAIFEKNSSSKHYNSSLLARVQYNMILLKK